MGSGPSSGVAGGLPDASSGDESVGACTGTPWLNTSSGTVQLYLRYLSTVVCVPVHVWLYAYSYLVAVQDWRVSDDTVRVKRGMEEEDEYKY